MSLQVNLGYYLMIYDEAKKLAKDNGMTEEQAHDFAVACVNKTN